MEVINSFFSNIKDKLTNPFFGTLILVLVLHHWELWYAVINFDSDCTLDDKLIFIKNYSSNNLTLKAFIWDILQSILYMFLGYLIVVATRSLVLWVEFWLMPNITGKIINKNVVRKSEYDNVVNEREQYFDQYEEQRKNVRLFSKTIDEQTEQIKQKDKDLLLQSDNISNTIKELNLTKQKLEKLRKENEDIVAIKKQLQSSLDQLQKQYNFKFEKSEKYEHLFFDEENEKFYLSQENFPPEVNNKVNELKNEDKWLTFLALGRFFENGGSLGGEVLTEMIKRGLAYERDSQENFTPLGRIIWRYRKAFGAEV